MKKKTRKEKKLKENYLKRKERKLKDKGIKNLRIFVAKWTHRKQKTWSQLKSKISMSQHQACGV